MIYLIVDESETTLVLPADDYVQALEIGRTHFPHAEEISVHEFDCSAGGVDVDTLLRSRQHNPALITWSRLENSQS